MNGKAQERSCSTHPAEPAPAENMALSRSAEHALDG